MLQKVSFILLLSIAALLVGCQPAAVPPVECNDAIGCVEIAPGEPIRLGVLQALSGDLAPQGTNMLQSIELALDDRDRRLLGHPLEIQIGDSQCSEEGGTTAALKIVADPQIVGILGTTCSGAAASAMKIVSEAGMVMISGSCSAPSLTSAGGKRGASWEPGFFRTAQNDALAGRAAATFAFQQLGIAAAATINDGDLYTQGLTDTFEQAISEMGGAVVLAAAVNKGDSNMQPVLAAVAASGAEMLFFPIFRMEGDYIVLQASEMDELADLILMSADGLFFEEFIQAVGQAGVGMYFIAPARPEGPAYDAFVSRYEAKYNEPMTSMPYYGHTYDAANLLLDTLAKVAVQDKDGTLHIGRQALRNALYATAGYRGLTGTLTCDEYGDCGAIRLRITRLDDPAAGLEGVAANVIYTYPGGE
ncbi:MAG: branched-chain amino acid ABC transporter substrate-binding protein [Anaerolineales bacterium]|nr:branched-chain amino acid ABC transporter substrate-binding protein [Anaerolineales bacterium]